MGYCYPGGRWGSGKPWDFQFPLWDTVDLPLQLVFTNPLLSIPFMGYIAKILEIAILSNCYFQFPLWDTSVLIP